jgi:predicted Zn-dependent protease
MSKSKGQTVEPTKHAWRVRWLKIALLSLALVLLAVWGGRQGWALYHFEAAEKAVAQRQFREAADHLRKCLLVWPDDPETNLLAARTARRAGLLDEAAGRLAACERLPVPTRDLVLESFLLHAQQGRLTAQEEHDLSTLIGQNDPAAPLILEVLAPYYIYQYRLGSALQSLQRWIELQPRAVPAYVWRAQVLQGMGKQADAAKDCRTALDLDPDCDEARLLLANLLVVTQHMDEAAGHFERLRQRQPQDPAVILGLARCRFHAGQTKEAEQLLQALLDDHPGQVAALRERGHIALETGHAAEAEKWLLEALKGDPHDRDSLQLLYRCLEALDRPDEAARTLEKMKVIDDDLQRLQELVRQVGEMPQNAALRCEAGLICLRNGQEEEALRWLLGALQVDPRHAAAHQALADYYERIGKPDLAAHHREITP